MGEIPHPMKKGTISSESGSTSRANRQEEQNYPRSKEKAEATFKVDIDSILAGKEAELRAVERGNIHGIREKYVTLKVS